MMITAVANARPGRFCVRAAALTLPFVATALLGALVAGPTAVSSFPLPSTGIKDPAPHYQRYRRSEYPKEKGFFQWWYCWVRGNGTNYAFAYSVSTPDGKDGAGRHPPSSPFSSSTNAGGDDKPLPSGHPGAFGMFARVDKAGRVQAAKTVQFPLEDLTVTGTFDYRVSSAGGSFLALTDLGNGNARLEGAMLGNDSAWYTSGSPDMSQATVHWNFTTTRVHGWYGQPEFEEIDHYAPVIMWNTWAFASGPEGVVSWGTGEEQLTTQTHRAYLDMNWGTAFPSPPKSDPADFKEYHWGWYAVSTIPGDKSVPPVSLIAGSGSTWTGFPLAEMKAQFGDVELGPSCGMDPSLCSTRAVQVLVDDHTIVESDFTASTDGKVHTFTTTQDKWVAFRDDFGTAQIPLSQTVTLETERLQVVLVFDSTVEDYVRLLFPHAGSVFSDFEALGVDVTMTIANRTDPKSPWQPVSKQLFPASGGLEFGYHVPKDQQ